MEYKSEERTAAPENPGNPEGEVGIQMLHRMNEVHTPVRAMVYRHADWKSGMRILDVGCGGGAAIAEMLTLSENSRIDGVDHSEVSVEETKALNRAHLGRRVTVVQGDVGHLPFPDHCYDLVTAMETVYFWPDVNCALKEVMRVLKPGGKLLIGCESCDPDVGWPDPFGQMTIYLPDQLEAYLQNAGFQDIAYERTEDDMLCIWGMKPRVAPAPQGESE